MGCVDSKEKRFDQQQYQQQQQYHNQQRQRAAAQQQRRQQQQHHAETGQQHTLQKYRQQQQQHHQQQQQQQSSARRQSQSSNGSGGREPGRPGLMAPGLRDHRDPPHPQDRDTDRERRVVTDPRGRRTREQREAGHQHEAETARPGGFGQRNQFDRASQLRRSKKRKKSRENSILESSRNSEKSMERSLNVSKTCAKDIAIEETVKTLKTSLGPSIEGAENNDSRAEYHTKYGNLI